MKKLIEGLTAKIEAAYTEGLTVEQAERLAAEFLSAQLKISTELAKVDLDARMKKTGVKAVKAAVYLEAATKGEKKPADSMLEAIVNSSPVVQAEQDRLDNAEVYRAELERCYNTFHEAHVYARGVAKGSFNG